MSDDDRDIDIESDVGDDSYSRLKHTNNTQNCSQKRLHHNALERKRRDYIKGSFADLKKSVPSLAQEKAPSRSQILIETVGYIQSMHHKNNNHQRYIDRLKRQNNVLENQIRLYQEYLNTVNNPTKTSKATKSKYEGPSGYNDTKSESSNSTIRRTSKKLKVAGLHY